MNLVQRMEHARRLFEQQDIEGAFKAYSQVKKRAPNHALASRELARCALHLKDHQTAQKALLIALRGLPDDAVTWELNGDHAEAVGRNSDAFAAYTKAMELGGDASKIQVKIADILRGSGQMQRALDLFQKVLSEDENYLFAELGIGDVLRDCGHGGMALRWYSGASANHPLSQLPLRRMSSMVNRSIQRWHFPMINDTPRNLAFREAIRTLIKAGDTVLDIGTGSGLLAMMAAQSGAETVYACDDNPKIATTAGEVIRCNGLTDRIKVIPKRSTDLRLGSDILTRCDVLICEIFDAGVLGEDALWTIKNAFETVLKPDARILPSGVRVWAAPVESEELAGYFKVNEVCGFDLTPFNGLKDSRLLQIDLHRVSKRYLSDPFIALDIHFGPDLELAGRNELKFEATRSGQCHGFVFWYELLNEGTPFLNTGPAQENTHWRQAFLPMPANAADLEEGSTYDLLVRYARFILWFELGR